MNVVCCWLLAVRPYVLDVCVGVVTVEVTILLKVRRKVKQVRHFSYLSMYLCIMPLGVVY